MQAQDTRSEVTVSRSRRDPLRGAALRFRHRCFSYYVQSLEVSLVPFARPLPSYHSTPKASNNSLKSALDVSMNTPRLPASPMHAVHSPPEYAQPR